VIHARFVGTCVTHIRSEHVSSTRRSREDAGGLGVNAVLELSGHIRRPWSEIVTVTKK
jgi:hypothetical protein